MEDSRGSRKRKRLLVDVKIATSSSDAEEIIGKGKQVDLPHLVVGKILENLDFKDLLQCSLINKVWMHEARRLLREKHECALTVDLNKPAIKGIIKLNTTLAAAKWPLPYGSLSITQNRNCLNHNQKSLNVRCTLQEDELVESAIKSIILRAGPFRAVQLDVACDLKMSVQSCIVRKLLAEVQKTIKVMRVKDLFFGNIFENASRFPELKKFEIYSLARISDPDVRRIQNFLLNSDRLETVVGMSGQWLKLLETIPPARKLRVVKEFDFFYGDERAAEFAELEPKLEKLCIWRPAFVMTASNEPRPRRDETRSASVSLSLLLSSRASLIELQVAYEILEELRREKPFALFENVLRLKVDVPHYIDSRNFDKNPTIIEPFPKLEEVKVRLAGSSDFVVIFPPRLVRRSFVEAIAKTCNLILTTI